MGVTREQAATTLANELITFCDGLDAGGWTAYAARARAVARELVWAISALEEERALRNAHQNTADRCLQMLANHAADALTTHQAETISL